MKRFALHLTTAIALVTSAQNAFAGGITFAGDTTWNVHGFIGNTENEKTNNSFTLKKSGVGSTFNLSSDEPMTFVFPNYPLIPVPTNPLITINAHGDRNILSLGLSKISGDEYIAGKTTVSVLGNDNKSQTNLKGNFNAYSGSIVGSNNSATLNLTGSGNVVSSTVSEQGNRQHGNIEGANNTIRLYTNGTNNQTVLSDIDVSIPEPVAPLSNSKIDMYVNGASNEVDVTPYGIKGNPFANGRQNYNANVTLKIVGDVNRSLAAFSGDNHEISNYITGNRNYVTQHMTGSEQYQGSAHHSDASSITITGDENQASARIEGVGNKNAQTIKGNKNKIRNDIYGNNGSAISTLAIGNNNQLTSSQLRSSDSKIINSVSGNNNQVVLNQGEPDKKILDPNTGQWIGTIAGSPTKNNQATNTIVGSNNQATASQAGNKNNTTLNLKGSDNNASNYQNGNDNSLNINAAGNNNQLEATTTNAQFVTIAQVATKDGNRIMTNAVDTTNSKATVNLNGNGNIATQTLTNSTNSTMTFGNIGDRNTLLSEQKNGTKNNISALVNGSDNKIGGNYGVSGLLTDVDHGIDQINTKNSTVTVRAVGDRNNFYARQSNSDADISRTNITGNENSIFLMQAANPASVNTKKNIAVNIIGDNNKLLSSQSGTTHNLSSTIVGSLNTMDTIQEGAGNNMNLSATGNGSYMEARQYGNANAMTLTTFGSNRIIGTQVGDRNRMGLVAGTALSPVSGNVLKGGQFGNDNYLAITMLGSNNNVDYSQTGNNLRYSLTSNASGQNLKLQVMQHHP